MSTMDLGQLEEKFFLTSSEAENAVLIMPAADLLNEEKLLHVLNTYGPLIQAQERPEAAAFFISWYAILCSALHYMMFHRADKVIDLSFSNVTLQLVVEGSYPLFSFKLNNNRYIEIPSVERSEWMNRTMESFYKEQLTPLIQLLARLARVNPTVLWGQVVNTAYDLLEEELSEASVEEHKQAIIHHFHTRLADIDASAFGLSINPFAKKRIFIEDPADSNRTIALKSACCLAYCLPHRLNMTFNYCYTCPRLKEKDRAIMKANGQY
ncbi:IucA/IucC family C-terminal-domain containing protein [Paenibacillus albus]|uniref:Uncharacterized protein n=1 Tax=Paenibacillus albus TaxID=2495582 RepID=A0A3S9A7M5_9BACL|nr:IucA/IucC family C-terminal-domain containing protein [Paenibacillus albus]AZN41768.1 hypothetical protein EJC50_20390 [Paenibacillus albus]